MNGERFTDSRAGRRHHSLCLEGDNATPLAPATSTAAAVSR